jgi:hypothetical protein
LAGCGAEPGVAVEMRADDFAFAAAAAVKSPWAAGPEGGVERIRFATFGDDGSGTVPVEQWSRAAADVKRPGVERNGE